MKVGRIKLSKGHLVFFVCCFTLSFLFLRRAVVHGSSMAPRMHDGDHVFIESLSPLFSLIHRGDVVVFEHPSHPGFHYIKRIIGVPGDLVEMADGRVWVNRVLLDEPYVADAIDRGYTKVVHVDPGYYFVLGDNRPRSSDSREFGLVPAECLDGRVELCWWPLMRIRFIG